MTFKKEIDLLVEVKSLDHSRANIVADRFSKKERLVLRETSGPCGMVTALYDFAVNGGAVGVINLSVTLPANAIPTRLFTDALTSLTSAGLATVALDLGAISLKSATAFNDASYIGVDAQPVTPAKTTVASSITFTIAVAALTAGKMRLFLEYIQSES